MELVHEVFRHELRPTDHVDWVAKNWHEDLVTDLVEAVYDIAAHLHEDDFVVNISSLKDDVIIRV